MNSQNIQELIASFPRQRSQLPQAYKDFYEREYIANRKGQNTATFLTQKLEAWMHRQIASRSGASPTLEIGAGTLNHLRFEKDTLDYDIVEPGSFFYEGNDDINKVRNVYTSIEDIEPDITYERIVSIAVFEHMSNLPVEIARSCSHLRPGGVYQVAIPCEGELAWYMGWRLITGTAFYLRNKLDYGVLMRHEHINKSDEIVRLLRHIFATVRIKRFPIPLRHMSFYLYIEARDPDQNRCRQIIEGR
jgi:hypothetical protein